VCVTGSQGCLSAQSRSASASIRSRRS
jgi:hypothetical protein